LFQSCAMMASPLGFPSAMKIRLEQMKVLRYRQHPGRRRSPRRSLRNRAALAGSPDHCQRPTVQLVVDGVDACGTPSVPRLAGTWSRVGGIIHGQHLRAAGRGYHYDLAHARASLSTHWVRSRTSFTAGSDHRSANCCSPSFKALIVRVA